MTPSPPTLKKTSPPHGDAALRSPLYRSQVWLVRLRWLAGAAILVGGWLDYSFLHASSPGAAFISLAAAILVYNTLFFVLLRVLRSRPLPHSRLHALAWLQIICDLGCLTCLLVWTGGLRSPLAGFFVFHMIFASLLLRRAMAFAVAGAAIALVATALALNNALPKDIPSIMLLIGWVLTLLVSVYIANRIVQNLRDNERRLLRQNRRIRAMSARLRRHQQALIQQEKMFALGQMAAGVAHEVANPLASMDGLLQLLERRPEKITPESMLRLREQVTRIGQIVRQLTTFSRPGQQTFESANLNDLLNRALNVIRFDLRFKSVEVKRDLAGDLPPLLLQSSGMEQVIINLVINALDAMELAPVKTLTLRTRRLDDACLLEVSDTGTGIRPEHIHHLFEPFFTTKPVGKGTGLGLSISYGIIQQHGGVIEVESRPGEGALLRVRLPLSGPPPASRPRENAAPPVSIVENSARK